MKKYLLLIPTILICFCVSVYAASAPTMSASNIVTLKDAQHTSDTIPVPFATDDTATVTGFSFVTILANPSSGTIWNVSPYYSDGSSYHLGLNNHTSTTGLKLITQDTAWSVSTFGVDTMTIGVENLGEVIPSNTITIKLILFNQ